MRYIVPLITLMLLMPQSIWAWGKKGHDVIAYIAECHLTAQTTAKVKTVLDGRSMVYYANWFDSASHSKEYSHTKGWHYLNMELNESTEDAKRPKNGDILSAAESIETELRSGTLSKDDEAIALKMFIHIIGDMHQPMHLGRKEDEGGGTIPVVYFVDATSLHAAWDYHLIEGAHAWSYTEWQQQIDIKTATEVAEITSGSYRDWINASHEITKSIYRSTPSEKRIFYEYVDKYTPIIEQQFLYAGLRLANLLNDIYSNRK